MKIKYRIQYNKNTKKYRIQFAKKEADNPDSTLKWTLVDKEFNTLESSKNYIEKIKDKSDWTTVHEEEN